MPATSKTIVRGWLAKVAVGQPVAERAGLVVAVVLIELRDVVDDAAAAAGDVCGGAIGAGEGGDRLCGNAAD